MKFFKIFLSPVFWLLVSILLLLYVLHLWLMLFDLRGLYRHNASFNAILLGASSQEQSCIRKEDIVNYAESEGWRVDHDTREWRMQYLKSRKFLDDFPRDERSIRIYVKPGVPFAKEPGIIFSFDENNCLQQQREYL